MSSSQPMMLVVDDDSAARRVMRLACESGAFDVVEAADGAEAVVGTKVTPAA